MLFYIISFDVGNRTNNKSLPATDTVGSVFVLIYVHKTKHQNTSSDLNDGTR